MGSSSSTTNGKDANNIIPKATHFTNYLHLLIYKSCNLRLLCEKSPEILSMVIKLISLYIPPIYQIYGIAYDNKSSILGSEYKKYGKIRRLYSWESMVYNPHNIYCCNKKWFIKTIHNSIYGIGANNNYILGSNIITISNGICAGSINIKYQNGNIYTSKISSKSFNRFKSLSNINIIQMECGNDHSLFLSLNGNVYSMGNNVFGQCGIGNAYININQIILIDKFPQNNNCFISSISCGNNHSCCIDKNNKDLYCFGDNQYNQSSSNINQKIIKIPTKYEYIKYSKKNIIKARCGDNFTCCLCDDLRFYGFGCATFLNNSFDHKDSLVQNGVWYNTDFMLFKDFSVGKNHLILITKQNEIVTFGYKYHKSNMFDIVDSIYTDLIFKIKDTQFNDVDSTNVHSVIAGVDCCIFLFKN